MYKNKAITFKQKIIFLFPLSDPYCIDLAVRHICVFEFSASSHYERDL